MRFAVLVDGLRHLAVRLQVFVEKHLVFGDDHFVLRTVDFLTQFDQLDVIRRLIAGFLRILRIRLRRLSLEVEYVIQFHVIIVECMELAEVYLSVREENGLILAAIDAVGVHILPEQPAADTQEHDDDDDDGNNERFL